MLDVSIIIVPKFMAVTVCFLPAFLLTFWKLLFVHYYGISSILVQHDLNNSWYFTLFSLFPSCVLSLKKMATPFLLLNPPITGDFLKQLLFIVFLLCIRFHDTTLTTKHEQQTLDQIIEINFPFNDSWAILPCIYRYSPRYQLTVL